MAESETMSGRGGQRTLAAILFTDVVGFSARVQAEEEHTLKLVQRDFAFMTKLCDRTGGQVLKSTGDGLLMFFNSAVAAVKCALEIQRSFARAAEKLPPKQLLQHRIGIHLGDVFMDGTDVMGDGVNIAARLQAEAEPGGICISQTVYDVVKSRVGVQTTYLGPRELKNIREAVPVYRILLAAHDEAEGAATGAASRWRRLPKAAWLGLAGAAAAALGVGIWLALSSWGGNGGSGPRSEPPPQVGGEKPGPTGTQPASPESLAAANRQRIALLNAYDFEGLVAWVKQNPELGRSPMGQALKPMYQKLAFLIDWFQGEMTRRSETRPLIALHVKRLEGRTDDVEIWGASGGRLAVKRGGAVTEHALREIKPPLLAVMMLDALSVAPGRATLKRELREALVLFARQYSRLGYNMRAIRGFLGSRVPGALPPDGPRRPPPGGAIEPRPPAP